MEERDLPDGWCLDADGALRRETVHSMLRRLLGWDYQQRAIYQITVTLEDRASQALGSLEVKGPDGWIAASAVKGQGISPDEIEARVVPSAYGLAALDALDDMPRLYPQVKILARQLMPDHLHFIAYVTAQLPKPFGNLVRGFKAGAAKRWREDSLKNERAQNSAKNGRAQDCPVPAHFCAGIPVWSAGFQDTILFREGQLGIMFRYLADNPRRLAVKRLRPELFRVVSEIAVPLHLDAAKRAIGRFAAIGNRFLLDRQLAQAQVSRHDFAYKREPKSGGGLKIMRDDKGEPIIDFETPAYSETKESLFAAARHGSVIISPCVSDGERQIAREALQAGYPLVTLQNKGFSPMQKPPGRYFDACAEGRLLMLAPAAWPYQPGEKSMTRPDATAMNRLAQWIAGENAAEINYHGMKPANIDELAIAAVYGKEVPNAQ